MALIYTHHMGTDRRGYERIAVQAEGVGTVELVRSGCTDPHRMAIRQAGESLRATRAVYGSSSAPVLPARVRHVRRTRQGVGNVWEG